MKRVFFIISLLLVCLVTFAQEPAKTVESFSISIIVDAVKQLVSFINWLFVIVFMLITWLLNDTSEATNTADWLGWFSKIPKALRALLVGTAGIIIFAWAFKITGRTEIFKLLLSLLMAMVVYKFGIDKLFRFLSRRFGLKFE